MGKTFRYNANDDNPQSRKREKRLQKFSQQSRDYSALDEYLNEYSNDDDIQGDVMDCGNRRDY